VDLITIVIVYCVSNTNGDLGEAQDDTRTDTIETFQLQRLQRCGWIKNRSRRLLIINEALYFGSRMNQSLINANQIRATGIPVCDDPFARHRTIGIETAQTFIPFEKEGSMLYFESRVPTKEERESGAD
jgi:hypothetical protein